MSKILSAAWNRLLNDYLGSSALLFLTIFLLYLMGMYVERKKKAHSEPNLLINIGFHLLGLYTLFTVGRIICVTALVLFFAFIEIFI